jgi:hypothetical protein
MTKRLNLSSYRLLGYLLVVLCSLALADGALPQAEMTLLGGHILIGGIVIKLGLLAGVVLGCFLHPRINLDNVPFLTWALCVAYLIAEVGYLMLTWDMSLADVLQSYNAYYSLLLIGPALLMLRNSVPENIIVRPVIFILLVSATIAVAQYLTGRPLLYTGSTDGSFQVQSWDFFGQVRAFGLFSSGLNLGLFCALCGALGVGIFRNSPLKGALLCILSAITCFTTLTRLCYLVFACACTSALVFVYGKKTSRGLWHPFIYAALGISTMIFGLTSLARSDASDLESQISLFDRISQWVYYLDVVVHSTLTHQVFGLGIVQNDKLVRLLPMIVDNAALALVLHIGVCGLVIFSVLLFKMWLYLRREAITTQQPFVIAAASLWATLICAGLFNIIFSSFGAVFALAILCQTKRKSKIGVVS